MDRDTLRIIDANLNRLREALRVVEDHARFALDDLELATRIRTLRHRVRRVAERLGQDTLLDARASEADVGRTHATDAAADRTSSEDIVAAALGRIGEAARSVAEYAKLVDPQAARLVEALRYDSYALAPAIRLRAALRRRLRGARLYLVLSESACRRPWLEVARAALDAGLRCLQLREKALPDRELLDRARRLRDLTRSYDALLILNDRPDIARLAAADGVHVGPDDLDVAAARRIAGGSRLVGASSRRIEQLRAAAASGADYVAVGAMFPTQTKTDAQVRGVELLRQARRQTELPIVAIGGITPERVGALVEAGADLVAVCSAICGSDDPAAATRAFLRALEEAGAEP